MRVQERPLDDYSIEDLDMEVIARGARIPDIERFKFIDEVGTPERDVLMSKVKEFYNNALSLSLNESLRNISIGDLFKELKSKIDKMEREQKERKEMVLAGFRGIWEDDDRIDTCDIEDEQIIKNAHCVAAICKESDLIDNEEGYSILRVKNYGKTFNLCIQEPFRYQPAAAGRLCTGFLVKDDVIATAGHCTDENGVTELRIVFGFKMKDASTPVTQVPNKNIYKGIKIIQRVYDPKGSGADWELIKLDRKVEDHPPVKLSEKAIYLDQPVYILGHPCGLPLKYASGAQVRDITEACFSADLNVYCGNSGSPVFDRKTHEVIGIVVRGDTQDFRWTGKGWLSVIYPNPVIHSQEPQCTRVSEFRDIVAGAGDRCKWRRPSGK